MVFTIKRTAHDTRHEAIDGGNAYSDLACTHNGWQFTEEVNDINLSRRCVIRRFVDLPKSAYTSDKDTSKLDCALHETFR